MLTENMIKFYYQNKKKMDGLFMTLIGIIVFLLFWFLPPATTMWDKIMHGMGYTFAGLSFVFGLLFLLLPSRSWRSYNIAEQIVEDKKQRKEKKSSKVKIAFHKTLALGVPVIGIVLLGCILWDYSWQNIGYALLFMVAYYFYSFFTARKEY